jgi:DNA repair exonuclease SbcCD ATPase subunit
MVQSRRGPPDKKVIPMPTKKKITIALVYEKLVQHDERFDQMDARLDQVDTRFSQVDGRFAKVDQQFAEVAKQFFRLEDSLKAEIRSVLDRLRQVEHVLEKQTADIEMLRQEYFALLQAARRIEDTLNTQKERDPKGDSDMKEIILRLERVEHRLSSIESQFRSN